MCALAEFDTDTRDAHHLLLGEIALQRSLHDDQALLGSPSPSTLSFGYGRAKDQCPQPYAYDKPSWSLVDEMCLEECLIGFEYEPMPKAEYPEPPTRCLQAWEAFQQHENRRRSSETQELATSDLETVVVVTRH